MTAVALIPARSGSKRTPGKNVRPLAGLPLLAWTIRAALASGVFGRVFVNTDSAAYATLALCYGAEVWHRHPNYARDDSPDIAWVLDFFAGSRGDAGDHFSILRPTSPFRTAATICRAFAEWQPDRFDSLRAMEPSRQHPAKQWQIHDGQAFPFIAYPDLPWAHSRPTQTLPRVYAQNASLEIAHVRTVIETETIAGERVQPFLTEGYEGFDINTEDDFLLAEALIASGRVTLPKIERVHVSSSA